MLDAKSTHYSLFDISLGSNGDSGFFLFNLSGFSWNNFMVLTSDIAYPYKTAHFSKAPYNGWNWLTETSSNASGKISVGYGSTVPILNNQTIRHCTSWWLVSPNVNSSYGCSTILGYGIPTTKITATLSDFSMTPKRVFWCEDNWKLRAAPSSSCQLSSDNKIASCPTTIGNQFLCVPQ